MIIDLLSGFPFLRIFLPAYTVLFFLMNLVVKTARFRKKYHKDPLVEGKTDKLQKSIERYKYSILVIGFLTILLYSLFPNYYQFVVPFVFLEIPALKTTGVAALLLSILFVRYAQNQLKQSWRIGVDKSEKTELITTGIYRKARNPIALGMLITLAGYFMVIPNAVTFSSLISGLIIANIRINIEEEYLRLAHGRKYEEYYKRTRKWL